MKIILVANQKGGTGKSTIAINLAHSFKAFCKTAILDLDEQGSLQTVKSLDLLSGVADFNESDINSTDILIVDSPPYLSPTLKEWIVRADIILVPVKPSFLDIHSTEGMLNLVREANKQDSILIIANQVNPSSTITKSVLEHLGKSNYSVAKTTIGERVSFTRSSLTESGIYGSGDKKAINEFESLCKEILLKLQTT